MEISFAVSGGSGVGTLDRPVWYSKQNSDGQRTASCFQGFCSAMRSNAHRAGYYKGVPSTNQHASGEV